jgi:COP9 signalosome complex subunit 7
MPHFYRRIRTEPGGQVLILAKSAKGRAAVALIQQTISNPSLYHFGEILDHENIIALEQSPEFKSYLDMLRIFAYGTLSEYRANPSLPPIDDVQV